MNRNAALKCSGVLFLTGMLLFAACSSDREPDPQVLSPQPVVVPVLELEKSSLRETVTVYGVIEAAGEIAVTVDFSAPVKNITFDEGLRVRQGDLLFELDMHKRKMKLEQARTVVRDARARLDETRQNLKRRQNLAEQGTISSEDLDSANIAHRRARAQYEDALAAISIAEREVREGMIYSPATGLIDKRLVEPGETVMPGQILATIQATELVRVVTWVNEVDMPHLNAGDNATVSLPGIASRQYAARIESLGARADVSTGNFSVKLMLENQGGQLRPGMTARVQLFLQLPRPVIVIPSSALCDRNRRRVAYVVRNERAEEVEPVVRASSDGRALVLQGLAQGDLLITGGHDAIVDGTPVCAAAKDNVK
ncbi:MAG: efflux RND transporter periplasmic adaptor subunit [Deltaproteobacteria bacterium]|nr:efflux RND transporter periplasmic adaptor subunit [Deltaproteobacteria bacterium]